MKVNDITVVSIAERSANVVELVLETTLSGALALDGQTLTVKNASGNDWKVYEGYSCVGVTVDANDSTHVHAVFARALSDQTEAAINQLDANVAIVQAAAESAQQTAESAMQAAQEAGTSPAVEAFARIAIVPMAATMTDEQALETSTLWPEWSETAHYVVDDIVRHGAHLYRCEQEHDSQASWTPDASPSLWSAIDLADDGIEVWTQPTGAHDAYSTGDKVHYPGKSDPVYVSTIDGNVWAPDAYPQGWQLEEAE